MPKQYHDPEWVREQYWECENTQREIGEKCGVSATTIRKSMKKHGIPTGKPAGKYHGLYGQERRDEVKEKISDTLRGREFSEETLQKMSESHRGNRITDKTRRKISESLTGIPTPERTRRRLSESTKGVFNPMWIDGAHADNWYRDVTWKIARSQIRETQTSCQYCGHSGSDLPLDVHHIVPKRFFEVDETIPTTAAHELGNLIRLCRSCHKRAEHGGILLEPNFDQISPEVSGNIRRLWIVFLEASQRN